MPLESGMVMDTLILMLCLPSESAYAELPHAPVWFLVAGGMRAYHISADGSAIIDQDLPHMSGVVIFGMEAACLQYSAGVSLPPFFRYDGVIVCFLKKWEGQIVHDPNDTDGRQHDEWQQEMRLREKLEQEKLHKRHLHKQHAAVQPLDAEFERLLGGRDEEKRKGGRRLGNDRRVFCRRLQDNRRKILEMTNAEGEESEAAAEPRYPADKERRKKNRRHGERRSRVDRRRETVIAGTA